MCGIVGYAGSKQAAPVLLDGLSKLEYRGYDSAGICVQTRAGLRVEKTQGRLTVLSKKCDAGRAVQGTVGIGHTRWATHGAPSDVNSHPHLSDSGKIAVVHNGIIENEARLRTWLESRGQRFRSQTDTEVISNLIGWYYGKSGNFPDSVRCAMGHLEGSFALGIMCNDCPGTIIAVKKDSPLVFGFGEGENYIASDVPAILKYTKQVAYLDDGDMAVFDGDNAEFYDSHGDRIEKKRETIRWELASAERGGYDHFMIKEIFEQPRAVRDTISQRIQDGRIVLDGINFSKAFLQSLRKIYFVACGSAYYVSVLAKYTIERACRIPTEAVMASEFRYSEPVLDDRNLVVFISQSGETADTLAALREAKSRGARTLAIVNVVGSSIAKVADQVIYTWAGPEISVATTKAFSTQLAVVYLLNLYMADVLETVSTETYDRQITALLELPDRIGRMLSDDVMRICQFLASHYCGHHDAFYVGRNMDSAVCLEGSLKLKEIAYLHSEAYPAGELKHGPISMIEEGTLVIALATVDSLFDKTMANIKEVKARGAKVICITAEGNREAVAGVADHVITISAIEPAFRSSLSLIPLQLFAYYMAVERGCDVDKPRNLAKSVTVE